MGVEHGDNAIWPHHRIVLQIEEGQEVQDGIQGSATCGVLSSMPQTLTNEPCTATSSIRPQGVISSMASGCSRLGQRRDLSATNWAVMAPRL